MARQCMNCGKGVQYGHNVSHAKNRTRKLFQPNLHAARVQIGAHMRKVRLCTKCLRMFKDAARSESSVQAKSALVEAKAPVAAA